MSEEPKKEDKKQEDQPKEEEIKLSWPPLESDPKIFNDYFHSIGMKPDVYFKEIISLVDISAFLSISGPLLGVILNFFTLIKILIIIILLIIWKGKINKKILISFNSFIRE